MFHRRSFSGFAPSINGSFWRTALTSQFRSELFRSSALFRAGSSHSLPSMRQFFARAIERLDTGYRDRPYFVGQKARLLAAFNALLLVFVPLNIAKLLWVAPPAIADRILFNALFF